MHYIVIHGAFMNSGQLCMSTERIIVGSQEYPKLVESLRAAWSASKRDVTASLFTQTSTSRSKEIVEDALALGAISVLDDRAQANPAPPAVLGPITEAMRIYREETFAPLAGIIVVESSGRSDPEIIQEMIKIANDSEYGLTAAVWSRDVAKATGVANELECGAVHINSPVSDRRDMPDATADAFKANGDPPLVPFGGWKSSGWGRFNGIEGIRGFTQVSLETTPKTEVVDAFEKTRSIEVPMGNPSAHPMFLRGDITGEGGSIAIGESDKAQIVVHIV